MDDWEKAHYGRDVWSEYNRKKKPGTGLVEFEEGYKIKTHKVEIEFSKWIHDNLGGDLTLLVDDNKPNKVNTADYIWNGKLWELKTASTEKSVKSSLKKGLKQISSNLGGIMLDFGSNDFSIDLLKHFIEDRMHWYVEQNVDIMIVEHGRMISVFRYKK